MKLHARGMPPNVLTVHAVVYGRQLASNSIQLIYASIIFAFVNEFPPAKHKDFVRHIQRRLIYTIKIFLHEAPQPRPNSFPVFAIPGLTTCSNIPNIQLP
jgi:hypothetical protein